MKYLISIILIALALGFNSASAQKTAHQMKLKIEEKKQCLEMAEKIWLNKKLRTVAFNKKPSVHSIALNLKDGVSPTKRHYEALIAFLKTNNSNKHDYQND